MLYFIHYGKENKYHYDIEEVKGELKDELKTLVQEKKTDKEVLKEILTKIQNNEIKYNRQLLAYCISNNYVDVLRKYGYILNKCL